MGNSISSALASISISYSDSLRKMNASLTRLGTLKRFQTASEDLGSYLKLKSIQNSQKILETASNSITEGIAFLDVADAYATSLLSDLTDLKAAAFDIDAATGDADAVAAAEAVYDGILNSIGDTLSTEYNGVGLDISVDTTFETVRMANGGSLELSFVSADDGVSDATLGWVDYATTEPLISAQITQVNSFIAKVGGYEAQLDSQDAFVDTMISNFEAAETNITAIDVASETAKYTTNDIRQQAALSMISQANISRRAILNLFDFS